MTFTFLEDGSVVGRAEAALNNDPPMYFTFDARAETKNREICTSVTQRDIDSIQMFLGDEVFDAEQTKQLEKMVREGVAGQVNGKVVCQRHFVDGDLRKSTAFIDGAESPDLASEYVWIEKDAGYRLFTAEPILDE